MLGRSSGNHDWLLANAIACVSCGFHLRNASYCVWMETGLNEDEGEELHVLGLMFISEEQKLIPFPTCFEPTWAIRFIKPIQLTEPSPDTGGPIVS